MFAVSAGARAFSSKNNAAGVSSAEIAETEQVVRRGIHHEQLSQLHFLGFRYHNILP